MPIHDDGDLIRAVGFLAIYFANLEDEVDELIKVSAAVIPPDPNIGRRNFTDRIRFLRKAFAKAFIQYPNSLHADHDQAHVRAVLQMCKDVAKRRNGVMHNPIFGTGYGGAFQKLRGGGTSRIMSGPVYKLANVVSNLGGNVYGLAFVLQRLYAAKP